MDNLIISTSRGASQLREYNDKLNKEGMQNPIVTKTLLRFDILLATNQKSYEIDLQKAVGSMGDLGTELKLAQDHRFYATDLGVLIRKAAVGSGANTPLFTHPDTNFFVAANEASSLETLYQGTIQFRSDNIIRSGLISTILNRYIPEKSYQVAQAPQGIEQGQFGPSLEQRGFQELNPIEFYGKESNKLVLTLGEGSTAGIAANTYAVVLVYGLLYSGQQGINGFC